MSHSTHKLKGANSLSALLSMQIFLSKTRWSRPVGFMPNKPIFIGRKKKKKHDCTLKTIPPKRYQSLEAASHILHSTQAICGSVKPIQSGSRKNNSTMNKRKKTKHMREARNTASHQQDVDMVIELQEERAPQSPANSSE